MRRTVSILLLLVFALSATMTVAAQEVPENLPGVAEVGENPGNAVQVDLGYLLAGLLAGGFGIGGAYERAITENISVKVLGGFVTSNFALLDLSYNQFDIYGQGRYYIWPLTVNGLYAGVGAGVTIVSFQSGSITDTSILPGLLIEAGYKFTLGDDASSGFFIEPFAGWQLTFGSIADIPIGGFRWGFGLGYAF
jgi:hypothetical protein